MDIKNEITEFIREEESNGALLITGDWGCGKTRLVKQLADEFNQRNEFAIAVVSLFGIDSVAMLHKTVKDAYLEFGSKLLGKKARKAFAAVLKLTQKSAKVVATAWPKSAAVTAIDAGIASVTSLDIVGFTTVKNVVGVGKKCRKFAIAFDDFERCDIEKTKLIGAINEYAENRAIKTILIADEKKIIEDKYKEFKEKLITRTVKMTLNQKDAIRSIIEEYKDQDSGYKEFIVKRGRCFEAVFLHSGYNNLRTLKSCISDFRRVYTAWRSSNISMDDIENVLYKFCAIEFETRANRYKKADLGGFYIHYSGAESEKETKRREILDKYLPMTFDDVFPSITSWIVNGDWNEANFIWEIKEKYAKEGESYERRFLSRYFWDLQQEDINKGMPAVVEKAYQGKLSRNELISLLRKIHALREKHISLPCVVDYSKMERAFDERKRRIREGLTHEPKRTEFAQMDNLDSEALLFYRKIEILDKQLAAWKNRDLFIKFLNGEKNVNLYDLQNGYIDCFDDELYDRVTAKYSSLTNEDRRKLILTLDRIGIRPDEEEKRITIKNLELLREELKKEIRTSDKDQMKAAVDKECVRILENKISQVSAIE